MRKFALTAVALAVMAMVGLETRSAHAGHGAESFGLHIGGRNVSFSVGSSRGYGYPSYATTYRRPHVDPRRYGREDCPSRRANNYRWHETRHWGYVPGGYLPHYTYVPSRAIWQDHGYWDRFPERHPHGRR